MTAEQRPRPGTRSQRPCFRPGKQGRSCAPYMNLPSFKVASAVLLFAAGGFGEFAGGFYDLLG